VQKGKKREQHSGGEVVRGVMKGNDGGVKQNGVGWGLGRLVSLVVGLGKKIHEVELGGQPCPSMLRR